LRGEEREGAEWVVREGVGVGGEMNQALYAHMNNKRKMKKKI
jgi:NaMN:DMB phosphoribosyltransferase